MGAQVAQFGGEGARGERDLGRWAREIEEEMCWRTEAVLVGHGEKRAAFGGCGVRPGGRRGEAGGTSASNGGSRCLAASGDGPAWAARRSG